MDTNTYDETKTAYEKAGDIYYAIRSGNCSLTEFLQFFSEQRTLCFKLAQDTTLESCKRAYGTK